MAGSSVVKGWMKTTSTAAPPPAWSCPGHWCSWCGFVCQCAGWSHLRRGYLDSSTGCYHQTPGQPAVWGDRKVGSTSAAWAPQLDPAWRSSHRSACGCARCRHRRAQALQGQGLRHLPATRGRRAGACSSQEALLIGFIIFDSIRNRVFRVACLKHVWLMISTTYPSKSRTRFLFS